MSDVTVHVARAGSWLRVGSVQTSTKDVRCSNLSCRPRELVCRIDFNTHCHNHLPMFGVDPSQRVPK